MIRATIITLLFKDLGSVFFLKEIIFLIQLMWIELIKTDKKFAILQNIPFSNKCYFFSFMKESRKYVYWFKKMLSSCFQH